MAEITDCSPEEALWTYHNQALAVVEQKFRDQITALGPQMAAVEDAVASLNETIAQTFGEEPDNACAMPLSPKMADIEAMVSTPSLAVVNGKLVLPGTLSIVALRRLYGIFGSMGHIARYVPEFSIPPTDSDFGVTGLQPRLLVIELRHEITETVPNVCAPDDVIVSEREILVGVNSHVTEDDDDRVLVCVWIGRADLTDASRMQMVELGLTDDEIVDVTLSQSSPGFEVYTLEDPYRLWQYTSKLNPNSEDTNGGDNIGILLTRPLDAVNDNPSPGEIGLALRAAMTTPTVTGCGFPVALGLFSTIDTRSVLGPSDPECDLNPNVFGPVNEVFGAMGAIQRTVDRILSQYQNTVGQSMASLVSTVTTIERKYLGRGLVSATVTGPSGSFGLAANYMGSSRAAYSSAGKYGADTFQASSPLNQYSQVPNNGNPTSPLIPTIPNPPEIDLNKVEYIINQLNNYMELFTESVNAVTQIITGMSLLMCSVSWVGNTMDRFQPNIGLSDHLFKFARPPCANAQLTANIDMSSINFDLCNVAIAMLKDLLHRLITLLNSLIRAQQSSNALVQLNCSVTETTQLATDIGRRLAAHNWSRF